MTLRFSLHCSWGRFTLGSPWTVLYFGVQHVYKGREETCERDGPKPGVTSWKTHTERAFRGSYAGSRRSGSHGT